MKTIGEREDLATTVETRTARIVVGVNDSPVTIDALRWAAALASRMHARLQLVSVYVPDRQLLMGHHAAGAAIDLDHLREALRGIDRLMSALLAHAGVNPAEVEIERRPIANDNPAVALSRACEGAVMLVLGAQPRKRGGGYVPNQLTLDLMRSAPCPVVAVTHQTAMLVGDSR